MIKRYKISTLTLSLSFCMAIFFQSCTNEQSIPKYAVFEKWLTHAGDYNNPYTEVEAYAEFTAPSGETQKIPLFWNGAKEWGLRFAPDQKGEWKWEIISSDKGLDGTSGSFVCTDASTHGGIKVWEDHPYHFVYQDGTPFWLFGETHWALTNASDSSSMLEGEGCNTESVKAYIDTRAKQGFNLINIKLVAFGVNEGGDVFHRERVYDSVTGETINPDFWKVADERLRYLHKKGITGFLYMAWQKHSKDGSVFRWSYLPDKEARLRYARYVVARYSALNVAFAINGEWKPGRELSGMGDVYPPVIAVAREIEEWDPHNRLIAEHGGGDGVHHQTFATHPEIDIADNQQVYEKRYQRIREARKYQKPVINGEYGYYLYKFYGNLSRMRQNTWKIAMAGGYFVTGWGSTYFGGVNHWTRFGTDANPRNIEWGRQVVHIRDFFTGLDWWEYEPVDDLVLSKRGKAYSMKSNDEYLVYLIDENWKFQVLLDSPKKREYKVTVFNPRTGQRHLHGHYPARDTLELVSPDGNDWMFRIKARAAK